MRPNLIRDRRATPRGRLASLFSRRSWQGNPDLHIQPVPLLRRAGLDPAAMQADDAAADRQPQPRARQLLDARCGEAHETLEHAIALVFGQARSLVFEAQRPRTVVEPRAQLDEAACRRDADRV